MILGSQVHHINHAITGCWQILSFKILTQAINMMMSSNGNIFVLLAFCAGNSPVTGEFPAQRSVKQSFEVFFDLHLKQQLSKQWAHLWFETPSCSLWRHCYEGELWFFFFVFFSSNLWPIFSIASTYTIMYHTWLSYGKTNSTIHDCIYR